MCKIAPDFNKLGFNKCNRENLFMFTFKFPFLVVIDTLF